VWRLKKLRPDPETIAKFRRDNLQAMRQVCRTFTLLCKRLDLFSGALVAIDGSTCKAVHAKARNVPQSKLQRLLPQIDAHIEGYRKELERGDTAEDHGTSGGARAEHLHANMAARKERKRVSQACQEQRLARGEAPRAHRSGRPCHATRHRTRHGGLL
jgi:transposase